MLNAQPISAMRIRKTAEIVAGQIRNAIVRGELGSGDNLPAEAQLITTFEVSRPTIREAIRILESERLISVSRGARGGAKIVGPSSDFVARTLGLTLQAQKTTLSDVYAARSVIEPPAARMAAETRPAEAADALQAIVDQEYAVIDDRRKVAEAASEFHRLLVEMSGNHTLALIGDALRGVVEKHASMIVRVNQKDTALAHRRRAGAGFKAHQRLVDLIRAGDGVGAEAHWHVHMSEISERWLPGLGSYTLDVLEE